MRIGICIPARGQMEVNTAFDLTIMVGYLAANTKHKVNVYTSQGTLIFDQRNSLVRTAVEEGCDYILFIDADMRFPKNTLERLLSHNKDSASSICGYTPATTPLVLVKYSISF